MCCVLLTICYSRLERDLYARTDQFGVEIREWLKWDIREAMVGFLTPFYQHFLHFHCQVGTETFEPKHAIIATWKNVSFAGGIPQARRTVS